MSTLSLENIRISLRASGKVLINDLTLNLGGGEIATVMGPSGSGKSTLLAFVSGQLDSAFEANGTIRSNNTDISDLPPETRHVGILFQDDMLFPHLTVGENLAFGLSRNVKGKAARMERVNAALRDADLAGFGDRDPATLSGGQRTRAALMRTLLSSPQALLLDEPFSKLDRQLRQDIRTFVFEHAKAQNLPVLMVTHDHEDAAAAGGKIITI